MEDSECVPLMERPSRLSTQITNEDTNNTDDPNESLVKENSERFCDNGEEMV